jgi:trehalose-phosphatase
MSHHGNLGLGDELVADLQRAARVPNLLVATDYDGTLAPIVVDPLAALPLPGAIEALESLVVMPRTGVAVVTGRSRVSLQRVCPIPPGTHVIASHGAEFDDVDLRHSLTAEQAMLRAELADAVATLVRGVEGIRVEVKPAGVAVHVRETSRADATRLIAALHAGPGSIPGVRSMDGKEVVELSVLAVTKGAAVQRLRERLGADAVVFLGDDVTDETVFAVQTPPDVAVKVGPEPTAAPHRVPDVATAVATLTLLATLRPHPVRE